MKTRTILLSFLGILALAWAWDAFVLNPMPGDAVWVARKQGIYLTGIWAMGLMSLTMILATRPAWLEPALGGMDRIYRLHKWAGILAISLGVAHWLLELGGGALRALVGAAVDKPPRVAVADFLQSSHGLAKDVGEWVIYALIVSLLISLWKAFPYKSWRILHRVMPLLYLALVFHSAALTPAAWWLQPLGLIMGALMLGGSLSAIPALRQRIGHSRRHAGRIESVRQLEGGVTEVNCAMGGDWPGHRAGQFAFVTFDAGEGAHPYTIASADRAGRLTFQIKALGDYTRTLARRLHAGQAIQVEGPYGRFDHHRGEDRQAWVAGGIGITPFLAWLESLQGRPDAAPCAQLHYCVRDAARDPFVGRLRALCAALPGITLHVHDAGAGQRLDADILRRESGAQPGEALDVWFCGPAGLARQLEAGLRSLGFKDAPVHREAFEMR
ncbi:ferric reductase-like transmembrane domain-containing protein [uncultured Castellaniella sp.]|uniref:ferredoxin reductase family protein n=1 Tax=uncultured Castellaniella sp. TaxID=647907 RepID=UPI002618D045|nr:ferric reductase-like transmembrane domain-containing protein [uncultured Castellaniella sp.]